MPKKQSSEKLFHVISGIIVIIVTVLYYWLLARIHGFPMN